MQYFLKYVMLICLSIVASCSDWKLRYLGYTNTIQIDDPKIDYSYAHKPISVIYDLMTDLGK